MSTDIWNWKHLGSQLIYAQKNSPDAALTQELM